MKYFKTAGKNRKHYTVQDTYLHYKDLVKTGDAYKVDRATYTNICCEYFMYLAECVVRKGVEYRLPHDVGRFVILKTKQKFGSNQKMPVDFKTTRQLGKTVYHMNEHTNGYKYTWMWTNDQRVLGIKHKYRFIPSRANKRLVAKLLLSKKIDYLESTSQ